MIELNRELQWQDLKIIDKLVHCYVMKLEPGIIYLITKDQGKSSAFDSPSKEKAESYLADMQSRELMPFYEVFKREVYPAYTKNGSDFFVLLDKVKHLLPSFSWCSGYTQPFDELKWVCDLRMHGGAGENWKGSCHENICVALCLAALNNYNIDWVKQLEANNESSK